MSTAVNPYPTAGDVPLESGPTRTVVPLLRPAAAPLPAPRGRDDRLAEALAHARSLGVTAVWTADHSASVELARLAGPQDHQLSDTEAAHFGLRHGCPRQLALGPVRCAVYERILCTGTPFDIYRWVNLLDLATVWPVMYLPHGVRSEWERALHAASLG